jgi:putative hydrolase of the HAD superfamily
MSSNQIKAVFFDLDGTLRHSVPTGGEVSTAYVVSLGLRVSEEDRRRAMRWEHLYWASSADLRDDLIAHSADTENFWIEYSRRRLIALGASPDWALEFAPKVSQHMGEEYRPESIVPDDVRRTLPLLKQAGYHMAVISNRDRPFQEILASHDLSEFFPYALAAGEVDSYKPEPGVFKHALKHMDVAAAQTVYVGDNYYADVIGAQRAGLQPVLYDPLLIFPDANCTTIHSFDELLFTIQAL